MQQKLFESTNKSELDLKEIKLFYATVKKKKKKNKVNSDDVSDSVWTL